MAYSKEQIFNDSYVLIGPMGSGKTLISGRLGEKMDMPVLTLDMLCHCPHKIEDLEIERENLKQNQLSLKYERDLCVSREEFDDLSRQINNIENDIWVCNRRIAMRKILPNLPNFRDLGFKGEIADYLDQNFGENARLFYRKQFEIKMLQSLVEQLPCPCVIDMGGTMTVALEDEYREMANYFQSLNEQLYNENFDLKVCTFDNIKQILQPFKNIIALQLPANYEQTASRAAQDRNNQKYIASGQYESLATKTIDVSGLVQSGEINREKLHNILNEITSQKQNFMQKI